MTKEIAKHAFQVLAFQGPPSTYPEPLAADLQFILNRYTELKAEHDFQTANVKARTEWLHNYLTDNWPYSQTVIIDDNDQPVKSGDEITFSYGIPPVKVNGLVSSEKGELWVICPGHNPPKAKLATLRDHVGVFYKI